MDMKMVKGVVFVLVFVFAIIMFYAVFIWPLTQTANSLNNAYQDVSNHMGWHDANTVKNGLAFPIWALVGVVVVAVVLCVLYLMSLAHKDEYDQHYVG